MYVCVIINVKGTDFLPTGTLAVSLMNAINQGNTVHAETLLHTALNAKANFRIEPEQVKKQEPEPEFM